MHHHLVRGHNKVSHVDTDVVTRVITAIEAHFEKVTVTRGKEYVFLGMNIVYKENSTAVIGMQDYLRNAIKESHLNISRAAATSEKKDLWEIDPTSPALSPAEAKVFTVWWLSCFMLVCVDARTSCWLIVFYAPTFQNRLSKTNSN